MDYAISIETAPARHLLVKKFHVDTVDEIGPTMGRAFGEVMAHAGRHGIAVEGPAVGHYTRHGDGFDVAAGFVVSEAIETEGETIVGMELPPAEVATTTHIGPYAGLHHAYRALAEWAAKEGRMLDDSVSWEEYWSGPEVPESEHRTVLRWPLRLAAVQPR